MLCRSFPRTVQNLRSNFTSYLAIMDFFFGSAAPEIPMLTVSTKPINSQVANAEKTMENIPAHLVQQLEEKITELKTQLSSNPAEWEPFMKDKGVVGIKRFAEGGSAVLRSETVLPFHILDIFEFINNRKNMPVLDPMVNNSIILKRFSPNSWVNYMNVNGVSKRTHFACIISSHFNTCGCGCCAHYRTAMAHR